MILVLKLNWAPQSISFSGRGLWFVVLKVINVVSPVVFSPHCSAESGRLMGQVLVCDDGVLPSQGCKVQL